MATIAVTIMTSISVNPFAIRRAKGDWVRAQVDDMLFLAR
jgi:hypothetical protein